jgi:predicted ATPase
VAVVRERSGPTQALTTLVGREPEVRELGELLRHPEVRLLTLTGSGGIGKTRLALAAVERFASEFADGAVVVSLGAVGDPELVALALARTLGLGEQGSEPIFDRIARFLAARELLVLLDNFEHVLDAASLLARLLSHAPRLKLLVTSRVVLRLSVENVFAVPPLTLPDPAQREELDAAAGSEAVALFVQRARAIEMGFALTADNVGDVSAICARLEGVPLALELAAARIRVLTPHALISRLEERLPLLRGGPADAPRRQQTLRASLDWSHELLDEGARELFARLSVFAGGFTFDAASSICKDRDWSDEATLDGLAELADHSLLEPRAGWKGDARFGQLEIVREYARERLERAAEADRFRRLHAEHFLVVAEGAEVGLRGPDRGSCMGLLHAELDNLRAALGWLVATDPELALTMCGALRRFWRLGGYLREAERWIENALEAAGEGTGRGRAMGLIALSNVRDR